MVALYWFENFLLTYWFMREVFPTPESPKMITFSKTFLRDAIFVDLRWKKIEYEAHKGKNLGKVRNQFCLFCDVGDHKIVKQKWSFNFWTLHIENEPDENLIENSFSRKYPWKIYVMMGVFSLLALSLFLRLWRTFLT